MNPVSILLLGLAMSTDAFAAALAKGAGIVKPTWSQALRIGLIFGVVEAITPMIGWLVGSVAARLIDRWDHWLAFALLFALGLHMLYKAFLAKEEEDEEAPSSSMWSIALTGLATSIDAMAVGVGLAFVQVNIVVVSTVIGLCTFALVTIGIMAGRVLSTLIGKWAEALGGLVLIAVGATILYEHLSAGVAS